MMKKTKLIRSCVMALFVLVALLLVYLVVRQTMPDIIPLLRSGDEAGAGSVPEPRHVVHRYSIHGAFADGAGLVHRHFRRDRQCGRRRRLWRLARICNLPRFPLRLHMESALHFTSGWGSISINSCRIPALTNLIIVAKSEHPAYMVVTLCFLPLIPNGFISIAASRSRLKPWEFTLAMFFGSAFSTFVYCWLGSNLDPWRLARLRCAGRADAEHCVFAVEIPEAGAASGRTVRGKKEVQKWNQNR